MSNLNDIWRDIHKRLGFFTAQNRKAIPDAPGIYAWFLPLWLFRDEIDDYINLIHGFCSYDPASKDVQGYSKRTAQFEFNWDKYEVSLQKSGQLISSDSIREKWDDMRNDEQLKALFSQSLMEASIFMSPLYIGKADSISDRYNQHVKGMSTDKNDFHNRFTQYALQVDLQLSVSDLLFVCIRTESSVNAELRKNELNKLSEQVVMRIAKPPFSIK